MCCNATFTRITKEIEEDRDIKSRFTDTYPTVSDISIPTIKNWIKGLNGLTKTQEIENAIEILTKIIEDRNLNKALDELNNLLRAEIEQQRAIELPQDNNRL